MEEVNYFLGLFIEQTNNVQIRSKSTNLMSSIFYWMLCFISQRREEIILVLITFSFFNTISIILNISTTNFEKIFSCWLRPLRVTLFMLSAVFMFSSNSISKQNITRLKISGWSKVKTLPWPSLLFWVSVSYQLTHFMLLVSFYTSWKYQKTRGFLIFSGGIERDQCRDMCWKKLHY